MDDSEFIDLMYAAKEGLESWKFLDDAVEKHGLLKEGSAGLLGIWYLDVTGVETMRDSDREKIEKFPSLQKAIKEITDLKFRNHPKIN